MKSSDSKRVERPQLQTILDISESLRKESIPEMLSRRRDIPRILLTAARHGTEADENGAGSGTSAMVEALSQLSRAAILTSEKAKRPRSKTASPFETRPKTIWSEKDRETMQRAGTWATSILTECITGSRVDAKKRRVDSALDDRVAHQSTSTIFVAPRDRLDIALLRRYVDASVRCVGHPTFCKNDVMTSAVWGALSRFSRLSATEMDMYVPIIESAAESYRQARPPLLALDEPCKLGGAETKEGDDMASYSVAAQKLSPEACTSLALVDAKFRCVLRRLTEEEMQQRRVLSLHEERRVVSALANVAVVDMDMHWTLMDEVRAQMSRNECPFGLSLWPQRRFYRGMFREILRAACSDDELETEMNHIVWRFPPFGRPLIRVLVSLDRSLRWCRMKDDAQRAAVEVSSRVLWRCIHGKGQVVWTANLQSLMICCESMLEMFCWAAFDSCAVNASVSEGQETTSYSVTTCASVLITLMNTVRLPGGGLTECENDILQHARTIEDTLTSGLRNKKLKLSDVTQARDASGLVGFAVAGIVGRRDAHVDVVVQEGMSDAWAECLLHAMEAARRWTRDDSIRERYERFARRVEDARTRRSG